MKLANSIVDLKPFFTANSNSNFDFRSRTVHPPSEEGFLPQPACSSSSIPEPDAFPSTYSSHEATITTINTTDMPLWQRTSSTIIPFEETPLPFAPLPLPFPTHHPPSAAHTHPPKTSRVLQSLSAACRRLSSGVSDRVPGLPTLTSWVSAWVPNPPPSPPANTHNLTSAGCHDDNDLAPTASPSPYDIRSRSPSSAAAPAVPSSTHYLPPRPDCGSSQSCSIGNTTSSNSSGVGWSLRFISFSSHISSAPVPRGGQGPDHPAAATFGAATNNMPTATVSIPSSVKASDLTNCSSSSENPGSAAITATAGINTSSATVKSVNAECRSTCTGPSIPYPPALPQLPPLPPQLLSPKQLNNSDAPRKETLDAAIASSHGFSSHEDRTSNSNNGKNSSSGCIRYSGFKPMPIPCEGLLYLDPSAQQTMWSASRGSKWSVRQYDITRKLYEGYASCVCKATCLTSHTDVVLKMYPLTELSGFVRHQVLRELDIHSRLKHPGVVQLLAAFREDDMLVIVLEYVRGGSLDGARRKLEGGRMAQQWVVRLVAVPLLRVLSCLHRQGLVHRDVKPDNLLLTPEWRLKLCDFGVSIDLAQERAVTRAGSCEYMAPEVNACPLKDDPANNKANELLVYGTAADVWSLGVVLYELLVGFPPFPTSSPPHSSSVSSTIAVNESSTPEPPFPVSPSTHYPALIFPPSVSPAGRSFISACLQPLPVDRPTVEQLLRHPWLQLAGAAGQQVG